MQRARLVCLAMYRPSIHLTKTSNAVFKCRQIEDQSKWYLSNFSWNIEIKNFNFRFTISESTKLFLKVRQYGRVASSRIRHACYYFIMFNMARGTQLWWNMSFTEWCIKPVQTSVFGLTPNPDHRHQPPCHVPPAVSEPEFQTSNIAVFFYSCDWRK